MEGKIHENPISEGFGLDNAVYNGFLDGFSDTDMLAEAFLWHCPMFYDDSVPLGLNCSKILFGEKYLQITSIKHRGDTEYAVEQSKVKLTKQDVGVLISELSKKGKVCYRIGSASQALSFEMEVRDMYLFDYESSVQERAVEILSTDNQSVSS